MTETLLNEIIAGGRGNVAGVILLKVAAGVFQL